MPNRFTVVALVPFVLAAGLAATSAGAKEWTTAAIAFEGAYEPWNLTKPDGTIDGFEPELAKDICARAKIECKFIPQDWDGMMTGLAAGKFDVIMDALSITPDRQKVIDFSKPYANTPAVFAVSKKGSLANLAGTGTMLKLDINGDGPGGKEAIAALRKALTGKSIGIQTATVYSDFIYKNFKDVATIREYKTSPEHDLDLIAGRIDAAFDDATYFTTAFSKPDNADLAFSGPEFGGQIWGPGEGLGIRKTDSDLTAKFDAAIAAALADGTVTKLSMKWFKLDVSP
jgi:octopine/nopaline transport system substrate-binding protein